jgi:DNA-binding beta-propeller fold protein YncE
VYVTDAGQGTIDEFDPQGTTLLIWGSLGTEFGQFAWPWGLAVSRDGYLYVAEAFTHRIQKFRLGGVPTQTTIWGAIKALYNHK